MTDKFIAVSGMPRAGSTLMMQVLYNIPEITTTGMTSPMAHMINNLRESVTKDPVMLANLGSSIGGEIRASYRNSIRSMVRGWYRSSKIVADKNRVWPRMLNELSHIFDREGEEIHLIVCIRDPAQVAMSIEDAHKRNPLIGFDGGLECMTTLGRVSSLFSSTGFVGASIESILNLVVDEIPDNVKIHYVRYEDLASDKYNKVVRKLLDSLGMEDSPVPMKGDLCLLPEEDDSHYKFKYSHKTRSFIGGASKHEVPKKVQEFMDNKYSWLYENFYGDME